MAQSLKSKLEMMAKLSAQGPVARKAPQAPAEDFVVQKQVYPLDYACGDGVLEAFCYVDAATFLGLGDLAGDSLDVEKVLFLDTETTGLYGAGVQAFLVGVGFYREGAFHLHQLLMRDLSGEHRLLEALDVLCAQFDTLVTYNGKSFDVPLLRARMLLARMRDHLPARHIDLLHPARRLWKMRLAHCALDDLEQHILHQRRQHDISGSEIPGRYFQYLRSQDERLLEDILLHNQRDVLSMAMIAAAMCSQLAGPLEACVDVDRYSMGRYFNRQGNTAMAQACFDSLEGSPWQYAARRELAMTLKRERRLQEAMCIWQDMAKEDIRRRDMLPYVELAKVYEHRLGDCQRALDYCLLAMQCPAGARQKQELEKRKKRLQQRLARQQKG
nr:ribonuclease H-like domain-containing protein [Maliibacterium massiliense]